MSKSNSDLRCNETLNLEDDRPSGISSQQANPAHRRYQVASTPTQGFRVAYPPPLNQNPQQRTYTATIARPVASRGYTVTNTGRNVVGTSTTYHATTSTSTTPTHRGFVTPTINRVVRSAAPLDTEHGHGHHGVTFHTTHTHGPPSGLNRSMDNRFETTTVRPVPHMPPLQNPFINSLRLQQATPSPSTTSKTAQGLLSAVQSMPRHTSSPSLSQFSANLFGRSYSEAGYSDASSSRIVNTAPIIHPRYTPQNNVAVPKVIPSQATQSVVRFQTTTPSSLMSHIPSSPAIQRVQTTTPHIIQTNSTSGFVHPSTPMGGLNQTTVNTPSPRPSILRKPSTPGSAAKRKLPFSAEGVPPVTGLGICGSSNAGPSASPSISSVRSIIQNTNDASTSVARALGNVAAPVNNGDGESPRKRPRKQQFDNSQHEPMMMAVGVEPIKTPIWELPRDHPLAQEYFRNMHTAAPEKKKRGRPRSDANRPLPTDQFMVQTGVRRVFVPMDQLPNQALSHIAQQQNQMLNPGMSGAAAAVAAAMQAAGLQTSLQKQQSTSRLNTLVSQIHSNPQQTVKEALMKSAQAQAKATLDKRQADAAAAAVAAATAAVITPTKLGRPPGSTKNRNIQQNPMVSSSAKPSPSSKPPPKAKASSKKPLAPKKEIKMEIKEELDDDWEYNPKGRKKPVIKPKKGLSKKVVLTKGAAAAQVKKVQQETAKRKAKAPVKKTKKVVNKKVVKKLAAKGKGNKKVGKASKKQKIKVKQVEKDPSRMTDDEKVRSVVKILTKMYKRNIQKKILIEKAQKIKELGLMKSYFPDIYRNVDDKKARLPPVKRNAVLTSPLPRKRMRLWYEPYTLNRCNHFEKLETLEKAYEDRQTARKIWVAAKKMRMKLHVRCARRAEMLARSTDKRLQYFYSKNKIRRAPTNKGRRMLVERLKQIFIDRIEKFITFAYSDPRKTAQAKRLYQDRHKRRLDKAAQHKKDGEELNAKVKRLWAIKGKIRRQKSKDGKHIVILKKVEEEVDGEKKKYLIKRWKPLNTLKKVVRKPVIFKKTEDAKRVKTKTKPPQESPAKIKKKSKSTKKAAGVKKGEENKIKKDLSPHKAPFTTKILPTTEIMKKPLSSPLAKSPITDQPCCSKDMDSQSLLSDFFCPNALVALSESGPPPGSTPAPTPKKKKKKISKTTPVKKLSSLDPTKRATHTPDGAKIVKVGSKQEMAVRILADARTGHHHENHYVVGKLNKKEKEESIKMKEKMAAAAKAAKAKASKKKVIKKKDTPKPDQVLEDEGNSHISHDQPAELIDIKPNISQLQTDIDWKPDVLSKESVSINTKYNQPAEHHEFKTIINKSTELIDVKTNIELLKETEKPKKQENSSKPTKQEMISRLKTALTEFNSECRQKKADPKAVMESIKRPAALKKRAEILPKHLLVFGKQWKIQQRIGAKIGVITNKLCKKSKTTNNQQLTGLIKKKVPFANYKMTSVYRKTVLRLLKSAKKTAVKVSKRLLKKDKKDSTAQAEKKTKEKKKRSMSKNKKTVIQPGELKPTKAKQSKSKVQQLNVEKPMTVGEIPIEEMSLTEKVPLPIQTAKVKLRKKKTLKKKSSKEKSVKASKKRSLKKVKSTKKKTSNKKSAKHRVLFHQKFKWNKKRSKIGKPELSIEDRCTIEQVVDELIGCISFKFDNDPKENEKLMERTLLRQLLKRPIQKEAGRILNARRAKARMIRNPFEFHKPTVDLPSKASTMIFGSDKVIIPEKDYCCRRLMTAAFAKLDKKKKGYTRTRRQRRAEKDEKHRKIYEHIRKEIAIWRKPKKEKEAPQNAEKLILTPIALKEKLDSMSPMIKEEFIKRVRRELRVLKTEAIVEQAIEVREKLALEHKEKARLARIVAKGAKVVEKPHRRIMVMTKEGLVEKEIPKGVRPRPAIPVPVAAPSEPEPEPAELVNLIETIEPVKSVEPIKPEPESEPKPERPKRGRPPKKRRGPPPRRNPIKEPTPEPPSTEPIPETEKEPILELVKEATPEPEFDWRESLRPIDRNFTFEDVFALLKKEKEDKDKKEQKKKERTDRKLNETLQESNKKEKKIQEKKATTKGKEKKAAKIKTKDDKFSKKTKKNKSTGKVNEADNIEKQPHDKHGEISTELPREGKKSKAMAKVNKVQKPNRKVESTEELNNDQLIATIVKKDKEKKMDKTSKDIAKADGKTEKVKKKKKKKENSKKDKREMKDEPKDNQAAVKEDKRKRMDKKSNDAVKADETTVDRKTKENKNKLKKPKDVATADRTTKESKIKKKKKYKKRKKTKEAEKDKKKMADGKLDDDKKKNDITKKTTNTKKKKIISTIDQEQSVDATAQATSKDADIRTMIKKKIAKPKVKIAVADKTKVKTFVTKDGKTVQSKTAKKKEVLKNTGGAKPIKTVTKGDKKVMTTKDGKIVDNDEKLKKISTKIVKKITKDGKMVKIIKKFVKKNQPGKKSTTKDRNTVKKEISKNSKPVKKIAGKGGKLKAKKIVKEVKPISKVKSQSGKVVKKSKKAANKYKLDKKVAKRLVKNIKKGVVSKSLPPPTPLKPAKKQKLWGTPAGRRAMRRLLGTYNYKPLSIKEHVRLMVERRKLKKELRVKCRQAQKKEKRLCRLSWKRNFWRQRLAYIRSANGDMRTRKWLKKEWSRKMELEIRVKKILRERRKKHIKASQKKMERIQKRSEEIAKENGITEKQAKKLVTRKITLPYCHPTERDIALMKVQNYMDQTMEQVTLDRRILNYFDKLFRANDPVGYNKMLYDMARDLEPGDSEDIKSLKRYERLRVNLFRPPIDLPPRVRPPHLEQCDVVIVNPDKIQTNQHLHSKSPFWKGPPCKWNKAHTRLNKKGEMLADRPEGYKPVDITARQIYLEDLEEWMNDEKRERADAVLAEEIAKLEASGPGGLISAPPKEEILRPDRTVQGISRRTLRFKEEKEEVQVLGEVPHPLLNLADESRNPMLDPDHKMEFIRVREMLATAYKPCYDTSCIMLNTLQLLLEDFLPPTAEQIEESRLAEETATFVPPPEPVPSPLKPVVSKTTKTLVKISPKKSKGKKSYSGKGKKKVAKKKPPPKPKGPPKPRGPPKPPRPPRTPVITESTFERQIRRAIQESLKCMPSTSKT